MEKIMNYFPPNPNGKIYYTELFKTFNKTPFNIKSRKFSQIRKIVILSLLIFV